MFHSYPNDVLQYGFLRPQGVLEILSFLAFPGDRVDLLFLSSLVGRALGTSKSRWAGRAWWTVGYKKRNQYMGLRRNKTKYREAFIEEKSRGLCLLRSCILKKHRRMFVICLFTFSEQNGSRVLRPKYDRKSNNFSFLVEKNLVAE